jgi:hypothetical protein
MAGLWLLLPALTLSAGGTVKREGDRVWIDGVPAVGWQTGQVCTFCGALSAALAVTEQSWGYRDLMGVSALAFRFRWSNPDTGNGWHPACCCGEFAEEYEAVQKATGWSLPAELHPEQPDWTAIAAKVKASIDAGLPLIGSVDGPDVACVFGYADDGRQLLLRHYDHEAVHECALEKSEVWRMYLGQLGAPLDPAEALLRALRAATGNWRRGLTKGSSGWYDSFYGEAGFKAWIGDLHKYDPMALTEAERDRYYTTNHFAYLSLVDARRCAATYLKDHAALLGGESEAALRRAAALYQQEADLLAAAEQQAPVPNPFAGDPVAKWTAEARDRQAEALTEAMRLEAQAVAQLDQALAAQTTVAQ